MAKEKEIAEESVIECGAATATSAQSAPGVSWPRALLVGSAVFAYFAVLTVWLPSRVVQFGAVESADAWVQDLAVTGVWAAALAIGLVGLRLAQRGGWI